MGPISKARASLRVVGECLSEEVISQTLCCKATEFLANDPSKTGAAAPRCLWFLRAPEDRSLEEQIEWLVENTTADAGTWARLVECHRVDIFCGLFLSEANEGFELDPELLKRLAERSLTIGFDIYAP